MNEDNLRALMDEFMDRFKRVLDDGAEQIKEAMIPSADTDAREVSREEILGEILAEIRDLRQFLTDQESSDA